MSKTFNENWNREQVEEWLGEEYPNATLPWKNGFLDCSQRPTCRRGYMSGYDNSSYSNKCKQEYNNGFVECVKYVSFHTTIPKVVKNSKKKRG
jgi:hypothetical protein